MKKMFVLVLLAVAFSASQAFADFAAWGIDPNAGDWTPNAGVESFLDNNDDSGGRGAFIGPGYGGQKFDAEALYFRHDANKAYIGIVTGLGQGGVYDTAINPARWFYPADIALKFGSSAAYQFGIKTMDANSDLTTGTGLAGQLYSVSDWNNAVYYSEGNPTTVKAGSSLGTLAFSYVDVTSGSVPRYFIETAIPLNTAGMDWTQGLKIHWTQTCGNDVLNLDVQGFVPPDNVVPEPVSMTLFGLGAGAMVLRRFRRKS